MQAFLRSALMKKGCARAKRLLRAGLFGGTGACGLGLRLAHVLAGFGGAVVFGAGAVVHIAVDPNVAYFGRASLLLGVDAQRKQTKTD